jgi:hypothetical protein
VIRYGLRWWTTGTLRGRVSGRFDAAGLRVKHRCPSFATDGPREPVACRRGLGASALTPATVEGFLIERRAAGYVSCRTARALEPLLVFLRRREAVAEPEAPAVSAVEALLARYACYLAGERGLAETTILRNVGLVRPFVAGRDMAGGVDLERLTRW